MVSGLLASNVPRNVCVGRNFVHYAVIQTSLRAGDDNLVPFFLQAEDGIERIHNFGAIPDRDQYFTRHDAALSF